LFSAPRPIRVGCSRRDWRDSPEENKIPAKIFVGNLNYQTTQVDLTRLLSEAGEIVDVYMPSDRATGRPRGFAFVEYSSTEEAAKAIEAFDGKELDGRALKINEAEERRRPSGPPAPSYSQGGGDGGYARPAKPKGSRRNLRRKKRSL
jgi:cold-inducible RNA-binding protein